MNFIKSVENIINLMRHFHHFDELWHIQRQVKFLIDFSKEAEDLATSFNWMLNGKGVDRMKVAWFVKKCKFFKLVPFF